MSEGRRTVKREGVFVTRRAFLSVPSSAKRKNPCSASALSKMNGINLLCDIGNGTMNLLYIVNCEPQAGRMFTEKYGTYQCTLMVREHFLQKTQREIPDAIIEQVIRTGDADILASDLKLIQ